MKNLPKKTDFLFIQNLFNGRSDALSRLIKIYGAPYRFAVHQPKNYWTLDEQPFPDTKKSSQRVGKLLQKIYKNL